MSDFLAPPGITAAGLDAAAASRANDPASQLRGALNATYAGAFPDSQAITYNPDGSVATVTEGGITTSYTYNADGTVATDTRAGVTRNYTYTSGNLTSITKAA